MSNAPIVAVTLAAVLATAGIVLLQRSAPALPSDVPNARSLHVVPVPRAGGYAVWLGFVPVALLFPPAFPHGLAGWLPPWLALVAISARDDAKEVCVAVRLAVHGIAALWVAVALAWPSTGVAVTLGLALAVAWSSNLYNFMDGSDGLAGTMGVAGFAAYGAAALVDGAANAAAPLFALAAALLPFLVVNRPPARMFLGDVGAVPLGFLAAAFGIAGVVEHAWDAWLPVLVFLPFLADASLTLALRIARRERWWQGHRTHYYQRLAQLGAGHRGTLRVYAALIAGCALSAIACHVGARPLGWWALAAWLLLVVCVFAGIDYHWRKKTNTG
jgi:UDP-GlcNAc:undecaprenyl-phosphate/decaprenyl-phosphate GlcNAc-1-phosphate transferase